MSYRYVFYGKYPQSVVIDENLIKELDKLETNDYILYDGKEYEKVIASPMSSTAKFNNGMIITNEKAYYFLVEPIKWIVLDEDKHILLSDMILDMNVFNNIQEARIIDDKVILPNNYDYSSIKTWLNSDFRCKSMIKEEVTFLEYIDMLNEKYGFENTVYSSLSRCSTVTDYARAKGCIMKLIPPYYGYGSWWLKTPSNEYVDCVYRVSEVGDVLMPSDIAYITTGIRPTIIKDI